MAPLLPNLTELQLCFHGYSNVGWEAREDGDSLNGQLQSNFVPSLKSVIASCRLRSLKLKDPFKPCVATSGTFGALVITLDNGLKGKGEAKAFRWLENDLDERSGEDEYVEIKTAVWKADNRGRMVWTPFVDSGI